MRVRLLSVIAALVLLPVAAVADGHLVEPDPDGAPGFGTESCDLGDHVAPGSGAVHRVGSDPGEHATVQSAVDAAGEGDTILIEPGTYHEEVRVETPGLRIRGLSRAGVVFDGQSTLRFAFDIVADRVLVENMTAHNYTRTAFFWWGLTGYWGRHLTAYNNGAYGLYAFNARCGQINDSYGSGNADSAFYIGECFTCDAVITGVVAEGNALGYSGTNAGGNLTITDSVWRGNALGIVPNSLDSEENPPQRGVEIVDNLIVDNNDSTAPGVGLTAQFWGVGVVIAGGTGNVVARNTVLDHAKAGIALAPLPDENLWIPSANAVVGNTVGHDPAQHPDTFDLAQGVSSGPGNCWSNNAPPDGYEMTRAPVAIQVLYPCFGQPTTPPGGDPRVEAELALGAAGLNGRTPSPWQTWPAPADPVAAVDLGDDDCDLNGDCTIATWLPALPG